MIIVILLLILSVSLISVALQNTIYVPLKFIFWTVDTSLAVYVIGAFSVGILVGLFFAIPNSIKKSLKLSGQNKSLTDFKKEIEKIKSKPASEEKTDG